MTEYGVLFTVSSTLGDVGDVTDGFAEKDITVELPPQPVGMFTPIMVKCVAPDRPTYNWMYERICDNPKSANVYSLLSDTDSTDQIAKTTTEQINLAGGLYDLDAEYARLLNDEEVLRVLMVKDCELSVDFLGFLNDYRDLAGKLPDDITTVVDLGCYAGIQAVYFVDKDYIGVDSLPLINRYGKRNTDKMVIHYQMSIQQFCKKLKTAGTDIGQYFAFCCNVPDKDGEWDAVRDTFKYYRITFPQKDGHLVEERLP